MCVIDSKLTFAPLIQQIKQAEHHSGGNIAPMRAPVTPPPAWPPFKAIIGFTGFGTPDVISFYLPKPG